ncbi:MAG: hypothetical protein JNL61_08260 [Rhizobiaceae bacterium]|nr:hypothetical protein [Rhizobiaceae bacterium]
MFFGVSTLQTFHVLISLVAIASGIVVVWGLITSRPFGALTAVFLVTTLLTNLTGFLFPFNGFTPAIGVGIVGTIVVALCLLARYPMRMQQGWRGVFVVTAVISLYLNLFVLVVQLFLKVPALHAYAPTGSEPPFAVAQGLVLIACVLAGIIAYRRFRRSPPAGATAA